MAKNAATAKAMEQGGPQSKVVMYIPLASVGQIQTTTRRTAARYPTPAECLQTAESHAARPRRASARATAGHENQAEKGGGGRSAGARMVGSGPSCSWSEWQRRHCCQTLVLVVVFLVLVLVIVVITV